MGWCRMPQVLNADQPDAKVLLTLSTGSSTVTYDV